MLAITTNVGDLVFCVVMTLILVGLYVHHRITVYRQSTLMSRAMKNYSYSSALVREMDKQH